MIHPGRTRSEPTCAKLRSSSRVKDLILHTTPQFFPCEGSLLHSTPTVLPKRIIYNSLCEYVLSFAFTPPHDPNGC